MQQILEQISNATLKFLSPLSLSETYKTIVDEALHLSQGDEGLILIEKKHALHYMYWKPDTADQLLLRREGFAYRAYKGQRAFFIDERDIRSAHPEIHKKGVKSAAFVPLSYRGKSNGVLIIRFRKSVSVTNKKLQLLQIFGHFASMAIRKAELYDNTRMAIEVRDDFLSLASHELRTPLTSINGYMEMLRNRTRNLNSIEAQWIGEVYSEVKRLTYLIQELLEMNRIRIGQLHYSLQECSLSELINYAIKRTRTLYKGRKILFTKQNISDHQDVIVGDKLKLAQAIEALVSNAVKFSPILSVVEVKMGITKRSIVIKVIDEGVGIPEGQVKRILQGFYKGKGNLQEGMGVGLLLAKYIIEFHKGTIEINTKRKKGTTVKVTFKRAYI